MNYIITENRMVGVLKKYLIMQFPSFNFMHYDWANFNCGMGECCDMYAIGFTLPEDHYDDYLFKLIESGKYHATGHYDSEMYSELPEPCKEQPNILEKRFDEYLISERLCEPFENMFGSMDNWGHMLLTILNHKFNTKVKRINSEYRQI